jgi:hypothetical protein
VDDGETLATQPGLGVNVHATVRLTPFVRTARYALSTSIPTPPVDHDLHGMF